MASKNDVVAHVRVTVGDVEVTKKNLEAIRLSATNTGKAIAEMKKQLQKLTDAGDTKGAKDLVKEINRQQNALNSTRKMLASWEKEVDSYVDVLQNLSGSTVNDLNRAARNLQAQLKQTATASDTRRWKQLNEAYREVMNTMDQISGKAPNLSYVLQNVGKVSNQSLAQSASYLKQLMQETDRTSEKGRKALREWKEELKRVQQEQAARASKVLANMNYYSEEDIRSSMAVMQGLQKDLRTGSKEWKSYADSIRLAKEHLDGYDRKQREAAERQKQQQSEVRAQAAITQVQSGSFSGSAADARQAVEDLKGYRDSLGIGTDTDEINRVNEALAAYEKLLRSVRETVVDVQQVLANPTAYGAREIEEAIKVLEEKGKEIAIGNPDAVRQNREQVDALRQSLSEAALAAQNIERIVQQATAGQASISDMERAVKVLNERLANTPADHSQEIERIRQQLDRLNPALAAARSTMANVNGVLGNLKAAPINSLREAAKALKEEMENVTAESEEFVRASRNLERVRNRIKELEGGATKLDKAFDRLKNWVLVYAGFSEVWNRVQQGFGANLMLSDQMSDVRKTTGLAADEVNRLSAEIQQLDTRITNQKLMATAAEAGRIGLSSREDVLGFVKASAVTLTALEELDEKAVASVMKLNELLGETKNLGVERAILSTASSINELSQASAAAPQPIIDFSRRFGGIAQQANISTAEVLAMGATIDALGQPIEMSSTALNKFTTALLSNGKAIAQDTGISLDYYDAMIKQGRTVDLMIEVLSRLNNMGGLQDIKKYMEDLGGEGARMTAVISALAASLPQLRANLELSNNSFREGTSVIDEYNVKNENAAALAERIGNAIGEMFVNSNFVQIITVMLSHLHSLVMYLRSGQTAATALGVVLTFLAGSVIGNFVKATERTGKAIAYLKAGFLSLRTASFSLAGALKAVGAAFKSVFLSNPVGWVMALLSYLPDLVGWFSRTRNELTATADIVASINDKTAEAAYKVQRMRQELAKAVDSKQGYASLISQLNLDYKEYLGHLVSEAAGYMEVAAAIDVAAAAQRRKIIEDERANGERTVNDKYREQRHQATSQLFADVVTNNQVTFDGVGSEFSSSLYQAIITGVRMDKKGQLLLSQELQDLLDAKAKVMANDEVDMDSHLSRQYGGDRDRLAEAYKHTFVNRIKKLESVRQLAETEAQVAHEVEAQRMATEALLSQAVKDEFNARIDEIEHMEDSFGITEKAVKDFTEADEQRLSSLIQAAEKQLGLMKKYQYSQRLIQVQEEQVAQFKKKEREVLLAFTENPLRGFDFKVGDNGKLLKRYDEEGRAVYKSMAKMSEADLDMLRRAYLRTESTLKKLVEGEGRLMDASVRQAATKLSQVKTAIKKELNANGLLIDEKGNFSLRTNDNSQSEQNAYNKEMQRAYRALLAGVEEFYTRQKQLANQQYIDSEMTHEQHQQRMDEIQRQHLLMRAAMQQELLTGKESFSEGEVLGRDAHVLGNYGKVKAWMPSTEHNFQAQVKADMQKGLNAVKEMAIKQKEEIEAILLDNNAFLQVSRQYQEQLEKLGILFINQQGLAADDFQGMQQRAQQAMGVLAQAAQHTLDGSADTFRKLVQSYRGVGDVLLATQQQDGSLLLQGTEEQWQAIYAIIMRYLNDIEAKRVQMFQQNQGLLNKIMQQDEGLTGLSSAKKGLDNREKKRKLFADWGTESKGENFKNGMDAEMASLDLEAQIYQRKWQLAQEFYDRKLAQEEDMAMRQELEMEKKRALAELEQEFQVQQEENMRRITESYMQEYDRRLEKVQSYAERIGDFAGTMASADWNSVEDRKRAGEELLRFMAEETKKLIIEWVTRSVKQKIQQKIQQKQEQVHQTTMTGIDQQGQDVRGSMIQQFGQALVKSEATVQQASEAQNLSHNVTTAGQDMVKTQVTTEQGIAGASAKIMAALGPFGMPLVAVVTGLLNMLLSTAMSSFSSAYGSAQTVNKGGKRLAAGMLTYAGGRYPVQGDDGREYDAQFEPALHTGVYSGGGGKAHFGIFSEQMPEMVVSGPTTRIIQQDYPQLMKAIMTIDRHGRLKEAMPVFARGNVDSIGGGDYPDSVGMDGGSQELVQAVRLMNETNRRLSEQLARGIRASINMYGKGGAKESMDKADRFYRKNKLN